MVLNPPFNHELWCFPWWWFWFTSDRKHSVLFCFVYFLSCLAMVPGSCCLMYLDPVGCAPRDLNCNVSSYLHGKRNLFTNFPNTIYLGTPRWLNIYYFRFQQTFSFGEWKDLPFIKCLLVKGIIWQLTKNLNNWGIIGVLEPERRGIILWTKTAPGVRHEDQCLECESLWTI